MAGFSTVSLVRESPEVVVRFARYYLGAGADEVLVYCDGAVPEALAGAGVAGLVLVACDAAFWEGDRPEALEARQAAVYLRGLARCRSAWLLVVDADEYVFGDRAIGAFLDAVPAGEDAVKLPTAEAVWGPGDDLAAPFGSTHFRTAWRHERLWRRLGRALYGEAAPYMRRGLIGHVGGKEFLRAGRPYSRIGNNAADRDGVTISRFAGEIDPALAGMYLGHFDAIGLARWTDKWRRRIEKETIAVGMTAVRASQMDLVRERLARGEGAVRALFGRFYGLSRGQYLVLSVLGCAFRRRIFAGGGEGR